MKKPPTPPTGPRPERRRHPLGPANGTIRVNQKAIASLIDCTKQNVSYHLGKIISSGELDPSMVVKEFLITAQSGAGGLSEERILYYNLDAIISVGYRINSVRATKFRIWATGILYRADGTKRISDASLVALTLMIAESHTDEMDTMIKVVVSLINQRN